MSKKQKPVRIVHELKTWPSYYDKVITGKKKFEIRELNRPFKVDDDLLLREWQPYTKHGGEYTGRRTRVRVTDIIYSNKSPLLPSFLQNGNAYGILSIEVSYPPIDEARLQQATGIILALFSILLLWIYFTAPNPEFAQWTLWEGRYKVFPYAASVILIPASALYWFGRQSYKKICKKFWAVKND